MVLEKLGSSLKNTLKKIAGAMFVNEKIIDELCKDIQRALLAGDVNVRLVFDLTKNIKERALQEKPPELVSQREHLIKIVYEELVKLFGEEKQGIDIKKKKPFKIMLVGLFGSGKTTTISKLAKYYAQRGHKVGALGLDVHRPQAMKQLEQVTKQANIPAFTSTKEKDPLKIYKSYEDKLHQFDVLLIDTAGRDALSEDLVQEIESVTQTIKPDERLLVLSADIGQAAQKQAEQFHKSCNITGIIVTKLDGTAKGGGSITACGITKAPIKFIGIGEKIDDLETFNPEGFVGRLLGMGDLEALLEKAKHAIDEDKAQDLGKKFLKGEFNFLDLYEQLASMKKMGSLHKIMDMIPGAGGMKIPKEMLDVQEDNLKRWRFILDSCTKEELEDPDILTRTRIERIAKGSGCAVKDVRGLLKQYKQTKKVMKMMKGKDPEKMMKKLGSMKMKT